MDHLERLLAEYYHKKYCCFTGSGTTALYLILMALGKQNKKVLYPAITCMAPVNAAIYAGYEPIFCDVTMSDYTMDTKSLESMLNNYDVGVIFPTHLYGHHCDMEAISRLTTGKDIIVIEDSAQTVELSTADASVMSFGHTKILESRYGGGAVFTNSLNLYKEITRYRDLLPNEPKNLADLWKNYRFMYYSIINTIRNDDRYWRIMLDLQLVNRDAFIFNSTSNLDLPEKLKGIHQIIHERNARTKLYNKKLNKKYIDIPVILSNTVLWRYSFLYKGNRDSLLGKVREQGIDISNWYPALYKMYSQQEAKHFKNANYIEDHIVNLWVDPEKDIDEICNNIDTINNIMINEFYNLNRGV